MHDNDLRQMESHMALFGATRKVHLVQEPPRMQCSADFVRLQTPELVAKTNKWMLDFFGTSQLMPDGEILWQGNNIYMTKTTYQTLITAWKERNKNEAS